MKTFEEKWTAWVDDQLTGNELTEFEAALPDKSAAEAEKRAAKQLGALLQRELAMRPLNNADFFSHQLRERIDREDRNDKPARASGEGGSFWWPIRRLVWAGAASLAIFMAIAVFVARDKQPAEPSQYLTQIMGAKLDPATGGPDATISIFEAPEDRVTVLWTEGLKSLPAEYAAK
jgi:anti-sigma factor RsiW